MTSDNGKRPIGLISIDTKAVFDRLCSASVGDTITYEELGGIIGRDIRTDAYPCLMSARRKALHEKHIVFGTVQKVGVRRLNDIEIVDTGEDAIAHIRRTSTRATRRITAVADYDKLPNDSKVKHNTYASVLGVMAHLSHGKQVKKIATHVEKARSSLPLQKTLDAFKD